MTWKCPLFPCFPAATITVSQIIDKYSVYMCHQKELTAISCGLSLVYFTSYKSHHRCLLYLSDDCLLLWMNSFPPVQIVLPSPRGDYVSCIGCVVASIQRAAARLLFRGLGKWPYWNVVVFIRCIRRRGQGKKGTLKPGEFNLFMPHYILRPTLNRRVLSVGLERG